MKCSERNRRRVHINRAVFWVQINRWFLALWAIALFAACPAEAVPVCPEGVLVKQPDGSFFSLYLRGDEYFSWTETAEGYPIVQDPSDGFWKYARPDANKAVFNPVAGARVGSSDPAALGPSGSLRLSRAVLDAERQARWKTVMATPVSLPLPAASESSSDEEEPPLPPEQPIPVSGTKTIRNIVLLACFSNHWDSANGTVNASYGRVNVGEYSNLFNQVNHTSDGAVGSVRDYYSEVSYGKLTVDSRIAAWVQLPYNESYYGTNSPSTDANWRQMISDAINAADAAGFDFSQGDSDGDGWVDCLTVLHSGLGEEYSGNPSTCIWSKQGEMSTVVSKDGVSMKRCHTEPALRGWTGSTSIIRIGTICHEMGHFFGLPDLYDYSATTSGLGSWSVMASGSWNGSTGSRPAHFCAYCKYMLGFAKPTTMHAAAGATLPRVEDNASIFLLRDGMTNGEYFLVENRANTGFDADTARIFPGVLIHHVYTQSANNDLGTWTHPLVKIEEADGDNSLGTKTSSSEAGDAWTSTSGLTGGFRDQTGNTTANAMGYQSSAYTRTDSSSSYSYIRVTNFSAAAATMSCNIQTLRTTLTNRIIYTTGQTLAWPAASQASQYELQEGACITSTSFSDGAENEEFMYDNWYLSGLVQRSTEGKWSGTASYAFQYYNSTLGRWYTPVQSITMKRSFTVTASTVVSFYVMSKLSSAAGSLKCQVSRDNGNTWSTLGTYNGNISSWTLKSYNYTTLSGLGISAGDACLLRFVMNAEYASGWTSFPSYGMAVDGISVTGVGIADYGNWTTLSGAIAVPSYAVPARTNGVYAYRVRAYANSVWQEYGTIGESTVVLPLVTLSLTGASMAEAGGVATVTATLSQTAPLPVTVNLAFSGSAAETNDYTASAISHAITISAGSLSGTLTLTAVQDAVSETNETIVVDIASLVNGEELGTQQVTATIVDDDPVPDSFQAWALAHCPGMDLPTAFTNDYNADGLPNGFEYAFGTNLSSNAPLLNIFCLSNTPVIDVPKQVVVTAPYVDISIIATRSLTFPEWVTNGLHAIDPAPEFTNRCWYAPDSLGTGCYFRIRGTLK